MKQTLIIFPNTNNVFCAEEAFNEQGYDFEIVSTPDDEKDCCGLSIKIKYNNVNKIKKILQKELIQYVKIKDLS